MNTEFHDIAARTPSDVWVVGGTGRTLIEHWNGSSWSVVPSQNVGNGENTLRSVTALAADNAWAVGYYYSDTVEGGIGTLIEHWNGTQWDIVASPNVTGSSYLQAVDAVSPTDIWAVGYYQSGNEGGVLTMHWNGVEWSVVPAPALPGTARLNGVSAIAADDVWAVGSYGAAWSPLALHWDGTAWTQVQVSDDGETILEDVTATGPDDVWAVGHYDGLPYFPRIYHWNGTQWSSITSPIRGSGALLFGVSAVAEDAAWAVGYYIDDTNRPFALRWDGTQWTVVATNSGVESSQFLMSVSASSVNDVWAAGFFHGGIQASTG
ncbi:MAG: hypothetical protein M3390_18485, partial [Chloroflexota bacterium]|nr:hypothetical protein [Chloroflexota bacterium]